MEIAINSILVVLPVLYTLLVMAYARIFARGTGGLALFVRPLLVGAVSLHFASIGLHSMLIGACPLGNRPEFLSLVAFSISLTYLILELRIGDRTTGVFALTPAFVLQLVAAVSRLEMDRAPEASMGVVESLHAFAAIVGFSAVALCGVYGLLYLFLYRAIKRGQFGLFYKKMPSLEILSDLNFVAAFVAFLALSATVGMGIWGYLSAREESVKLVHPDVVLTSALWLLYGCCVLAKRFFSLGGKRLAYTTAFGLVPLVGILFGGFFAQGFHG